MERILLALDSASARTLDKDGRLHVSASNISKATVNPYRGNEIPNAAGLGLDPDKIYYLYRDPVELAKGADTFARKPIMVKHIATSANKPQKDKIIGTMGSDIKFENPYLIADLAFWDGESIMEIMSDAVKELSCGYHYVAEMTPGVAPDGTAFDGRMTQIIGNHLALVESGRAGSDVLVADSNPFAKGKRMKMTSLGRAIYAGLRTASPKLAMDSAMPGLVGKLTAKSLTKAARTALKTKLLALDADLEGEQVDDLLNAVLDVDSEPEPVEPGPAAVPGTTPNKGTEVEPKAKDADAGNPTPQQPTSKKDRIQALLGSKLGADDMKALNDIVGDDGEEVDGMDKEEVQGAMDSLEKRLKDQFRALDTAKSDVRETVGEVMGMDSAESVYRFALDHLDVDHDGVDGVKPLQTLFKVASTKTAPAPKKKLGMDSALTAAHKRHPGLARFGKA